MKAKEAKGPRRGRPTGEGRAEIAVRASLLFRESGFDSVGIDKVMASCGKTAGSFYHHFDSKEDLILTSVEEAFRQSKIFLSEYLADCANSKARWKKWSVLYLSFPHLKNVQRGCPITALLTEVSKSSRRVKGRFAELIDQTILSVEGGSEVSDRHHLTLSTMVGALSYARLLPEGRAQAHLGLALKQVHKLIDERWSE